MVGGAWLVIGPVLSRTWEHNGAGPIGAPLYGPTRQSVELIGYFYGVGVLIVALSAFSLGRFVSRPALAAADESATPAEQPAAQLSEQPAAQAAPEPVSTRPARTPAVDQIGAASADSTAPAAPSPVGVAPASNQRADDPD